MFLRNIWYVAGHAADLSAVPLARKICGKSIVLFRLGAGTPVALEDRCGHRGMALSAGGECFGDGIRCPYHGLEFNARGECTRVPGQDRIPSMLNIGSYPVVEKDALVWVWLGDPTAADPATIVSHPYHGNPKWSWHTSWLEVRANAQLVVDNLLDLSHLQYVHKRTIGGNPAEESRAELRVQRQGNVVYVRRWLRDVSPPELFRTWMGHAGKIDRWQEFEFRPGVLQFVSGTADAGTGALEGSRENAKHVRHFHGVTPSTETSTLYFFSTAHDFRIDDEALAERMFEATLTTFAEDKALLEAQQARLLEEPERALMSIRNDTAIVHARKIMAELLAAERPADVPRAEPVLRDILRG
jgi:phenylpropionate dioxygenase-like ring-hydroxylating dioxygenase large terminal subunit